ncbi:MAG: hypothetical protein RQ842_02070 [Vulcanisaeta sp.]|jgi:hypothetical protein|nr:hypothetical protein [Vulcanisaeta sp.]
MRLREEEEAIVRRVVDALIELSHRGIVEFKHVDTERGLLIIVYKGCEFTIKLRLVYYPTDPNEWAWLLERWLKLVCD